MILIPAIYLYPILAIGLLFALLIALLSKALSAIAKPFLPLQYAPVDEQFKIVYPTVDMHTAYKQLINDIQNADDEHSIKMAYVDIIIFQGNYSNSGPFVHELIELYCAKNIAS